MAEKRCPCCGKMISEDAEFCVYCLTKFTELKPVPVPEQNKGRKVKNKNRAIAIIISAETFIIAALILTIVYMRKNYTIKSTVSDNAAAKAVQSADSTVENSSISTTKVNTKSSTKAADTTTAYSTLTNNMFCKNLYEAAAALSLSSDIDFSNDENFSFLNQGTDETSCSITTNFNSKIFVTYRYDGSKISIKNSYYYGNETFDKEKQIFVIILKAFSKQYSDTYFADFISTTDNFIEQSPGHYTADGNADGYSFHLEYDGTTMNVDFTKSEG